MPMGFRLPKAYLFHNPPARQESEGRDVTVARIVVVRRTIRVDVTEVRGAVDGRSPRAVGRISPHQACLQE